MSAGIALPAATPIALRAGTPRDLDFVQGLSQQAFAGYGDYSAVLPDWLADPAVQTVLAEERAGRAVGFAMLGHSPVRRFSMTSRGELLAIAVVADRRHHGIGRLLLEEIERRARAANMREIRLSTAETNVVARHLYGSQGFAVLAHSRRSYPSGQSALEMAKQL